MRIAVMISIYTAIAVIGLAVFFYVLRRAEGPGRRLSRWSVISFSAAIVMFCFPLIGSMIPNGKACFFFQKFGNIFLGFILYFFGTLVIIVLLASVFRGLYRLIRRRSLKPSPAASALLLVVLFIFSLTVNIYGYHVSHDVKVTHYDIDKEVLRQEEPLRIVLAADLHIGVNSSIKLYKDMVDRINGAKPDLVLIAGDIFTSAYEAMEDPEEYIRVLGSIQAEKGVYAVYGNHDMEEPLLGGFSYIGGENAVRHPDVPGFIEACGWHLLTDETIVLPELNGLVLAGRRDLSRPGDGVKKRASLEMLLKDIDPSEPVLLLQHEPEDLDRLDDMGVDLSVSGHTHDGQIFPGNIIARLYNPQSYGLMEWGSAKSLITSGVGFFGPPIRLGTISEVVVIDIS